MPLDLGFFSLDFHLPSPVLPDLPDLHILPEDFSDGTPCFFDSTCASRNCCNGGATGWISNISRALSEQPICAEAGNTQMVCGTCYQPGDHVVPEGGLCRKHEHCPEHMRCLGDAGVCQQTCQAPPASPGP